MSALCDGVSLPSKPNMYYTDSDITLPGTDSTRMGQDKLDDENSLTRLLHLQNIGTEIRDGEPLYNRYNMLQRRYFPFIQILFWTVNFCMTV